MLGRAARQARQPRSSVHAGARVPARARGLTPPNPNPAALTVAACNADRAKEAFRNYQPTLPGGEGSPAEFEHHLNECRYDYLTLIESGAMEHAIFVYEDGARELIDSCLAIRGYRVAE